MMANFTLIFFESDEKHAMFFSIAVIALDEKRKINKI